MNNRTKETASSVKLLGVQLDDELNFSLHVYNVCKSAANQLNPLIGLLITYVLKEKEFW